MTNQAVVPENISNCTQCVLKDFSVFRGCSEELLNQIFSHKTFENFKKGDFLITQGEEFKGVYCIQKGVVKVTKTGRRNKEFILWLARPGDIIGLDSFINNEEYSFWATAVDDVSACFIPAFDFRSLVTKDPAISIGLMKDLCDRINFIEDRITSMARKKVKEQCAEMLISLSVKSKKQSEGDIPVNYSVKDLASIVGTSQNYLYKILSDFSDRKVISLKNRKLLIKDFNKLSHIAVGDEIIY